VLLQRHGNQLAVAQCKGGCNVVVELVPITVAVDQPREAALPERQSARQPGMGEDEVVGEKLELEAVAGALESAPVVAGVGDRGCLRCGGLVHETRGLIAAVAVEQRAVDSIVFDARHVQGATGDVVGVEINKPGFACGVEEPGAVTVQQFAFARAGSGGARRVLAVPDLE